MHQTFFCLLLAMAERIMGSLRVYLIQYLPPSLNFKLNIDRTYRALFEPCFDSVANRGKEVQLVFKVCKFD